MSADAASGWIGNASADEVAEFLRAKRRVVLLTHAKPDGDAVGSSMGLVRALNQPGAWRPPGGRAEAWYFGPIPPWLGAVAGGTAHRVLGPGGAIDVPDADAVVVTDTGSWQQLEQVRGWLSSRREMTVVIDHHVQGDAEVAARRLIDTGAAAACLPVAEVCARLLGVPGPGALPADVAGALYLGLATDTGWFRHSNVSPRVMATAGELLKAGADHVGLYREVEQRESPTRLRLLARALGTLELFERERLAVMTLTRGDFQQSGAQPGESGGFVDFGQSIASVEVTALLTEASPEEYGGAGKVGSLTKISLRSKERTPGVDVNALAKGLGGGGHVRAAGARLAMPLDAAKAEIVRRVGEALRGR
jgi:phosphoesterase RecJ-like protein